MVFGDQVGGSAMAKTYAGKDIEIGFEMKRCIHARNCFLKLPQVFDPSR